MSSIFRCAVSSVVLLLSSLAQGDPSPALPRATLQSPIAPQPLAAALQAWARESGIQVLYATELARGLKSEGAPAGMSAADALDRLLAGTGLRYRVLNERTISVAKPSSDVSSDAERKRAADSSDTTGSVPPARAALRIAQVDTANQAISESSDGTASKEAVTLEEIVVTAQKRAERLIDVPISIVAMGAAELERRKITGIDDLSTAVSGVAIQSSGGLQRRIAIRGVSNVFGTASLVGIYLDEASVTARPDAQLDLRVFDLERIEVLRGPQGTLYGEGSVGGTIRFITKDPLLDRFGFDASVTGLYTEDGGLGERVQSVLNVPLVTDKLGLRIAGTYDQQDGWIDQPAAGRDNINEQSLVNVRIKGLWQIAPQFTAAASAIFHRNDAGPSIGEDANGDYRQVFNLTTAPEVEDDYGLYNVTLTYDFPVVRLLSTSTYIDQEKQGTNLGVRSQTLAPPVPRIETLQRIQEIDNRIWSEELRLVSSGAGPWQWTFGGFYRSAELDFAIPSAAFGLPIAPGAPLPAAIFVRNETLSKSWAAFGDTSYRITERLTFGVGLRYFEDDQRYTAAVNGPATVQTDTFDALNPRAYVQFKFTDRLNAYANAGKGFRSGGFNSLNQPSFDPEEVWTYELGTKTSAAGGSVSLDAAVFYSDYQDIQISGILPDPAPPFGITTNAGKARIKGVELALGWRPTERWELSLNGNYVDTRYYEVSAGNPAHIVGDPVDQFPEYSFTASIERGLDWRGKPGFMRLDYNQVDRMTYRLRNLGAHYFGQSDIINMLNLNMGLQWSEALSLSVFAQNLLNDRGFTDPLTISDIAARARPRTYGLQFGVTFD